MRLVWTLFQKYNSLTTLRGISLFQTTMMMKRDEGHIAFLADQHRQRKEKIRVIELHPNGLLEVHHTTARHLWHLVHDLLGNIYGEIFPRPDDPVVNAYMNCCETQEPLNLVGRAFLIYQMGYSKHLGHIWGSIVLVEHLPNSLFDNQVWIKDSVEWCYQWLVNWQLDQERNKQKRIRKANNNKKRIQQ